MQKVRKTEKQITGHTEVHISKNYHTTPGQIKQTEIINVPEQTVFMKTWEVLPLTPIIFGIKHFDRSSSFLEFLP